ncbi:sodium:solute symporter [Planctomycetota bacterium]|nr:sodium:solute symporter [Planctomycetota bacterium]
MNIVIGNMYLLDWILVGILLVGIIGLAYYTKRYTKSVADFLAANRCAGRYLLAVSEGMAGLGAISVIAQFQMFYNAGFTATFWSLASAPIYIMITLSGYVIYRYRETRAMTLAQYFEMRYSKGVRIYAGILAWVAGIVNFGIFPAVGARFFIYFCGIPRYILGDADQGGGYIVATSTKVTHYLASGEVTTYVGEALSKVDLQALSFHFLFAQIDLTYIAIMIGLLAVSLFFVFMGGQIAVMVTDFVQGTFTYIVMLAIIGFIFYKLSWSDITTTLIEEAPEKQSMLNPFDTEKTAGFNPWFYFISIFGMLITYMSWQGSAAYNSSAKNAHEARMSKILGSWRAMITTMAIMLLPIGVWVLMRFGTSDADALAANVDSTLAMVGNESIQNQMRVPLALTQVLPIGITGMFCAVMLFAFISTHDTYLHSWGSIFIQDVILPFRKKPFTPKQHIWLLRFSILFVAFFIFLFSLFFQQSQYILMFFAITGAIYAGGAGPIIIFGLYWKRGSVKAAWASLTIGWATAITGMILQNGWESWWHPFLTNYAPGVLSGLDSLFALIRENVWGINWEITPKKFPIDGQWFFFFSIILSLTTYITLSLMDAYIFGKPAHNMKQLLHRGEYRIEDDHSSKEAPPSGWRAILPSSEFTWRDKLVYWGNFAWVMIWFAVFLFVIISNFVIDNKFSDENWGMFWAIQVGASILLCIFTVIWFLIGGVRDMIEMFKTLSTAKRDAMDNGMVHDGHSLVDDELVEHAEEVEEATNA